jgi:hypothetical protein
MRIVLDDPLALAQLVDEHGGEFANENRRALLEQLKIPPRAPNFPRFGGQAGKPSPKTPRQEITRPGVPPFRRPLFLPRAVSWRSL